MPTLGSNSQTSCTITMSLLRAIRMNFPEWEDNSLLPSGLERIKTEKNAEIHSYPWQGPDIRRARLCELSISGKFTAETLVIYPNWDVETPIFGTEYITIANKKFFGAIDFHPLSQDESYLKTWIDGYLGDFLARSVEESKFYDLSKYFSSKFWIIIKIVILNGKFLGIDYKHQGRNIMCSHKLEPCLKLPYLLCGSYFFDAFK